MNIQGTGGAQSLAALLQSGRSPSAGATQAPPPGGLAAGLGGPLASLTNDQGQSLLDLRDTLRGAVQEALQSGEGSGDLRSRIEEALFSALEANGFDPQEVRGAIEEGGLGQLVGTPSGAAPASLGLPSAGQEDDIVQSFLQQFRAGISLDLKI